MIAAVVPFLLGNWKWLVPALLFAGLAIDDGYHRIALSNCHAARAADVAKAEKAKAEAIARAAALSDELVIAQAAAMAVTERTVTVYRDRIANATRTSTCGPVLRDAAAGVRATISAGGGQDDAGGKPAAAVPAAPNRRP